MVIRYLLRALQVLVFLGIAYYLYGIIQWGMVFDLIVKLPFYKIVIIILAPALVHVLFAIRIYTLSRLFKMSIHWLSVIRYEFEIMFAELVIPLPNAEDFFRFLYWKREQVNGALLARFLLFSRICGVIALLMLLPALTYLFSEIKTKSHFSKGYLIAGIYILLFALVLTHKIILHAAITFLSGFKTVPASWINSLQQVVQVKVSIKHYIIGTVLAIVNLALIAYSYYLITAALQLPITWAEIFLFTPALILAFLVPVTPQGIGVPQAAMAWYLITVGIEAEVASAVAAIHLTGYLLIVMVGGVLFIFNAGLYQSQVLFMGNKFKSKTL